LSFTSNFEGDYNFSRYLVSTLWAATQIVGTLNSCLSAIKNIPNHFLTPDQPSPFDFSLKTVGKLVAQKLHFGHPFSEHLCYPVSISMFALKVFMRSTIKYSAISAYPLRLCGSIVFAFRICIFGGLFPYIRCDDTQIGTRWHCGRHPLHLRHFSGNSRASRRHKMSIQRLAPLYPPVISADEMQNLQ